MFNCDRCEEKFDTKTSLNNHMRYHKKYDNIKDDIIDDYVNNDLTYRDLIDKYDTNAEMLSRILKDISVDFTARKRKRGTNSHKHSEKTKLKISEKRKKWLKDNPDKHVWKRNDKFISKPCEYLKTKFIENNINFLPEFSLDPNIVIDDYRNYSVDIAFPNEKIGIEVNGNQHYKSDGTFKKYYEDKNNYFIKNGWSIYHIYYLKVYNENFISDLIQKLKDNYNIQNIDYSFYLRKKKEHFCITCGKNKVSKKNVKCKSCSYLDKRKVKNRPKGQDLIKLIDDFGLEGVGRKYGITGSAVKKWLRNENIMTFDYFKICTSNGGVS